MRLALCMLVLLFRFPAAGQVPLPDEAVVALVNGEPVTSAEFRMHCLIHRSEIINRFLSKGVEYDADFWNNMQTGTTPMDALRKYVLDTLAVQKIIWISLRDAGLAEDISYEGFTQSLAAENARRSRCRQQGETIYGPWQYSAQAYYLYRFTNMEIRLKEHLAALEGLEEDQVRAEYDRRPVTSSRVSYETCRPGIRMNLVDAIYRNFLDKARASAVIKINEDVYGSVSL